MTANSAVDLKRSTIVGELQSLSTRDLWKGLATALEVTADSLVRLALIVAELQRRGEDVSSIKTGLASYLPLIASNKMAAEAVIKFAGQKRILDTIATLPVDTQRSLAEGETVSIVTLNAKGEIVTVQKKVHELTIPQLNLAVGFGKLRSLKDQRTTLENMRKRSEEKRRAKSRKIPRQTVSVIPEADSDEIEIAARSLDKLNDQVTERSLTLRLTDEEYRGLQHAADEKDISIQLYIRALMAAAGVF